LATEPKSVVIEIEQQDTRGVASIKDTGALSVPIGQRLVHAM
jgi:hypothetical protein